MDGLFNNTDLTSKEGKATLDALAQIKGMPTGPISMTQTDMDKLAEEMHNRILGEHKNMFKKSKSVEPG